MAFQKQIDANRVNALKSTGPETPSMSLIRRRLPPYRPFRAVSMLAMFFRA